MQNKAGRMIAVLCIVLAGSSAWAEARSPQLVITAFVEALQKNDREYLEKYVDLERIKNQPRHSYRLENLRALFADVDISKIECSRPVYDKKTKTLRVRMHKPLAFDYELQSQTGKGKARFYRIVAIHP